LNYTCISLTFINYKVLSLFCQALFKKK